MRTPSAGHDTCSCSAISVFFPDAANSKWLAGVIVQLLPSCPRGHLETQGLAGALSWSRTTGLLFCRDGVGASPTGRLVIRWDPGCMTDRHLVTLQVAGRPATFATAHEKSWKEAVRAAVIGSGVQPQGARFAVRMEFRLAAPVVLTRSGIWITSSSPRWTRWRASLVGDRGEGIRSRPMIGWTASRPPSGYRARTRFQGSRSMCGSSSRTDSRATDLSCRGRCF